MLLDLVTLIAVLAVAPLSDSASIELRSDDPQQPALQWLAFDASGRQVARGTAPSWVEHNSDGVPLTYCSAPGRPWLALTVEVRRGAHKGVMSASGACTRVTVRGTSVQVVGVEDPRLTAGAARSGSP